jgi:phage gpG-like protein
MREFDSFGAFALHLLEREVATVVALHADLKMVAHKIEETAKEEIGHYQPEVGPFPAWAPLAESTVADRVAQGYSPDEPLLRTGDLRDSISSEVEGLEAAIGSTSDVALYQELGTSRIPPRPLLGPAAIRNERLMLTSLGAVMVNGIAGAKLLPEALGYEFATGE